MIRDLARAAAFPEGLTDGPPLGVELRETHASYVLVADRDVFKVKKAVDYGFLDFRTRDRRRRACEAEVALNARLAPGVYLGVVPVVRGADGLLRFAGEGELVDWAVHMKRLPDEERADVRLARGELSGAAVDRIAARVARFHAECRGDEETARLGAPDAIAANVVQSFSVGPDAASRLLAPAEAAEIEGWQLAFVRDHAALFEERAANGRVRDGHGDLRLDHVYLHDDGGLTVIDCIEYDARFRCADVWADVAYLSMDLAWHGRVDLAERLLARYARASGDYDGYALVDFYESYRAGVSGKIAAILATDPQASDELRAHAAEEARRHFLLALAAHRGSLLAPALVCVGGPIASGKSTIADAIAAEMSAPVVDADRTRAALLGQDPLAPVDRASDDPAFARAVLDELLRRADVVLASGRPVVLDATFRSAGAREAARALARTRGVPIRFVDCRAEAELRRVRLLRRERDTRVPDRRLGDFDAHAFEPMDELPAGERVVVDTARPLAATLAAVRAHVQTWPRGFVA